MGLKKRKVEEVEGKSRGNKRKEGRRGLKGEGWRGLKGGGVDGVEGRRSGGGWKEKK